MVELKDILKEPLSAERYLEKKRAACREKYTVIMEGVRARRDDKTFVESTLREAEYALQHRFGLPGTRGVRVDVGSPPRWFEVTSDHEYTWVLSRHYWFPHLVNAYLLTGEAKYAEGVLADVESWIDSCPRYPVHGTDEERLKLEFGYGVFPWRSFEAGVRMTETWRVLYEGLLLTEFMTPELHAKISASAWEHADMLMVVAPILHPKADHNHYLVQMQGALDAVCMFPEWRESQAWQDVAIGEVVRCALCQFTSEGGQIEGTPGYHSMCLMRLFTISALSEEYGFALPDTFFRTLEQAIDYMCHSLAPSGHASAIGDTGLGKLGDSVVEDYYRRFGRLGIFRKIAPLLSEAARARIAPDELRAAEAYALSLPCETHFQTELGQYMARTGWDKDASYFMAVCHTPVNNGHSHQDPLTFCLSLMGDRIVVDPGSYTYENNVARRVCKSPEYHSCLTFGRRPPFYCTSSWGFTPQKDGRLYRDYRIGDVMAVDGAHDNYLPNEHARLFALTDADTFLVADRVRNVTGEDVSLFFHVNTPHLSVASGQAVSACVRILWTGDMQAQSIRSYHSHGLAHKEQACRLVLEDRSHAEAALYLTVFTKNETLSDVSIEPTEDGGARISYRKDGRIEAFAWHFNSSLEREQSQDM